MPKRPTPKSNPKRKKRIRFIAIVLSISLLALIFIIISFRENIVFFYAPSELAGRELKTKIIRVGGLVVKNSLSGGAMHHEFVVTDLKNELRVSYDGLLPNLFREGQGVVAKGMLNDDGKILLASELLVKHDENYMPPEVAKSLKR